MMFFGLDDVIKIEHTTDAHEQVNAPFCDRPSLFRLRECYTLSDAKTTRNLTFRRVGRHPQQVI